jgi:2-polyprenyl-3-methyl-5-hydroxy-6-metoxy-1,4-benzoquinol methylase
MRTAFSATNPFRSTNRFDHAYVWEAISRYASQTSSLRLLDYGCNEGVLIAELARSFPGINVVGIDKNKDAIARGADRFSSARVALHSPQNLVDWVGEQNRFDVVLAMGVVEHVVEQEALLSSLAKALKPGGVLIISVPGKNVFSWADLGNWKFYFPRLHRWFIERTKGADFYRAHFIECVNGLFGDVEVGKERHQHFRRDEIERLVNSSGFRVTSIDGYGFLYRILHNIWWFSPAIIRPPLTRAMLLDLRAGSSAELIVEARK